MLMAEIDMMTFVESLKYNAAAFLELAGVIADHPSLEHIDISHFTVQIKKEDLEKFKEMIQAKKPQLSLVATRKVFNA